MGTLRVLVAGVMALSLVLAACGSDGDGGGGSASGGIEEAGTCEELAEASVAQMGRALDDFVDMSAEELIEVAESGESAEVPSVFEKAAELDCDPETMARYVCDNIDQLSTEGGAATIVEQLLTEC